MTLVATDTMSTSNGNNDGVTFCGLRTYTISPNNLTFLTLTSDTVTLVTSDTNDAAATPSTITVTATLINYPEVTITDTFTVTIIDPCLLTILSFYPTVADMIATINSGADSQTLIAFDTVSQANGGSVAYCGARLYTISTFSPLTLVSDTLTLVSTDMTEVTTESITVTATLVNYPFITVT